MVIHEPSFELFKSQLETLVEEAGEGNVVVVPDFPHWCSRDAKALEKARGKHVEIVNESEVLDPRLLFFGKAPEVAEKILAFRCKHAATLHLVTPFVWRTLPAPLLESVCRCLEESGLSVRLARRSDKPAQAKGQRHKRGVAV